MSGEEELNLDPAPTALDGGGRWCRRGLRGVRARADRTCLPRRPAVRPYDPPRSRPARGGWRRARGCRVRPRAKQRAQRRALRGRPPPRRLCASTTPNVASPRPPSRRAVTATRRTGPALSSRSTRRAASTGTCGSSTTASPSPGRCPTGSRRTRRRTGSPSTPRTTRFSTLSSRGRSRRASTAPGR